MVHDFLNQVRDTVRRNALFSPGDTVFAAVSGGADSVALLHVLTMLKEEWGIAEICVLHVNHQLRNSADRDEQFVRHLCDELSLELCVKRVDVRAEAAAHHESLEEAGRRIRYAFFEEKAAAFPNAKIAVAHNADDQAETVLFHIIRGCGIAGLCGIPVSRDRIVRPLLDCSASAIRDFCKMNAWVYRIDETNEDVYYARNRIRHEILPSMQHINKRAVDSILRLSAVACDENAFLQRLTDDLVQRAFTPDGYDRHVLLGADSVITKRALKALAFDECGVVLQQSHTEALYDALKMTGNANLPSRCYAVVDSERLRFVSSSNQQQFLCVGVKTDIPLKFGDTLIYVRRFSSKEFAEKSKVHKNLFYFCVSYDMIDKGLFLRSRKTGDKMCPSSRGCTKALKKLYQEWQIPPHVRSSIPVLCDANDNVLAVVGYAVSEEAAVNDNTADILCFEILSKGCVYSVDA